VPGAGATRPGGGGGGGGGAQPAAAKAQPGAVGAGGEGGGAEDEEAAAMRALGVPTGFASTKGEHVEGNDAHYALIASKRKYRQYMNRKGGFNRPLDAVH
jgi:U4/U6.U5 tri-snRNP-associated protein 3